MARPVASWVEQHARRAPDRIALVDVHTGRQTTYATLAARARSLAWSMARRFGVDQGARVAVLSRNDARVFEVLYACALLGAIAVPLNWRLSRSELTAIVTDAAPLVVIHESDVDDTALVLAAGAGVEHRLAWASEGTGDDAYEACATAEVPPGWGPDPVDDDAVWTIIYTSGTTGVPKGVQATHAGVLASLLGILVAHRVDAASRCLTVLPTFHVAGLALFAHPTLYAGGTVVVARTFEPRQVLALLVDPRAPITHFCGVPANYQFVQQLPEFDATPMRSFVAAVGGAPVPPRLVSDWAARGVLLTTVFGITEAGACVTAMPPGDALHRTDTVGLPVLHARCRVRTVDDRDAAADETGELQITGPLVTPGYWRNPDETRNAFTDDGWLRTGDAAAMTADGHVVLVDRWKDMYISGGENVYPAEVENVLHAHPGVSQAAVVGTPDPRWGETGTAFVVPGHGAQLASDELVAWCRERLAGYKAPSRVELVDELPRNATGKVLKTVLRTDARRLETHTESEADTAAAVDMPPPGGPS